MDKAKSHARIDGLVALALAAAMIRPAPLMKFDPAALIA
jgi:hypothetical protein